jgi:hypothetical protein
MDNGYNYNAEMGKAWSRAIGLLHNDVKMELDCVAKKKNNDVRIDICFKFKVDKNIIDLLPIETLIRPMTKSVNQKIESKCFIAEIKRYCTEEMAVQYVNQFVDFYFELFSGEHNYILQKSKVVKQCIENNNTILLFLFDGVDNIFVVNKNATVTMT